MFFKKSKLFGALIAVSATLALGAGTAYANSTATISIKNNWTATATYSTSISSCAATVNPPFSNIPAGTTDVSHTAVGSTAGVFGCRVYYTGASKNCQYVVSRLTTLNVNPITGTSTKTWNYPQVVVTAGSGTTCNYTFTSVADTNAVVTATNGAFGVTLTMQ